MYAWSNQLKITKFLWNRIFTFNIDDALESAYESAPPIQESIPFHFNDDYEENRDYSKLPIVHLHGRVRTANSGFVFSTSEYVRQIKSINPWMVVLTQFLPVEPFIIAGTSLDEIDLEFYLSHRSKNTSRKDRGPPILIEPFPDSVTERDCQRYDLTLCKCTMLEFLNYIDASVPNRPTPLDLVAPYTRTLFPSGTPQNTIMSFASDFEFVPNSAPASKEASKFLYGHAPSWEDLAGNLDIGRQLTQKIVSTVEHCLVKPGTSEKLILIAEETGAGKTTLTRRLAYDLASSGRRTLICSALSQIDPQLTAEAIDLIDDPLIILVDNFADQATAIADTLLRNEKPDVIFVCTERRYRWRYLTRALSEIRFISMEGLELSVVEAEVLTSNYAKFGLLGTKEALTNKSEFAKKISADPIAIACCRILNDFRPLEHIVESLLKASNKFDLKRYLVTSLAHFCFRGGVRYEILSIICGRQGWEDQFTPNHSLPLSYPEEEKNFVIPLNSTLASRILEVSAKKHPDLLLDVFVALGNAIAPRVNRTAIRRRSPEARLAGRLFDYDQVVSNFLDEKSESFYSSTQKAWQWNSRYWEQVSLLNLSKYLAAPNSDDSGDYLDKAVRHARHAVAIETHPLPLTTLGKVLLANIGRRDISNASIYEEAFLRLSYAIELERSWSRMNGHPFVALFRGTRDFIAIGGQLSSTQKEKIRALISEARAKLKNDSEVMETILELSSKI